MEEDSRERRNAASSFLELDKVYKIGDKLGRGTFAQVYRAVHRETGVIYAVKEINKSQLDDVTKDLLKSELEVLMSVSKHPGIVTLHKKYECEDYIWFVMEYVDGGMLLNRLTRVGTFSENDARIFMTSTLRSLKYLAQVGVVHRDIKPENILFDSRSTDWPTRLADFGLSAKMDKHTLLYDACGTPAFCSPEVLQNEGCGCACDMWSFGVVLYIVLAGYPPFGTVSEIKSGEVRFPEREWSHISEEAKNVVRQMLIVDRERRITPKQALLHPWFRMKQSTRRLPNENLLRFNVKRNMRIHFAAVRSANSLLSFVGKTQMSDKAALLEQVERVREHIKLIEAQASSPVTPSPRRKHHDENATAEENALQSGTIASSHGSPPLCGKQPPLPPSTNNHVTQLSHSQAPLGQPALGGSASAQPRLQKRRRSLVLPSIDLSAVTNADLRTSVEVEDSSQSLESIQKKAEALLPHEEAGETNTPAADVLFGGRTAEGEIEDNESAQGPVGKHNTSADEENSDKTEARPKSKVRLFGFKTAKSKTKKSRRPKLTSLDFGKLKLG